MWVVDESYIEHGSFGDKKLVQYLSNDFDYGEFGMRKLHRFKMTDADGNLYYKGYCDDDSSFAPLDEFGVGAGAVDIYYYNKGWKLL